MPCSHSVPLSAGFCGEQGSGLRECERMEAPCWLYF